MTGRGRRTSTPASPSASSTRPGEVDATIRALLEAQGHRGVAQRGARVCAVKDFVFTSALLVGIDPFGYTLRYCYEHAAEAEAALAAWDGQGHPGGPWIKCKGAGIELLNPALSC